ncbi:UNKNOWN [Stylonychia lemnae]|uniref:Uncharacterized protein n=1 Tax=Stylonychia lemnae TaxID=5949 RepID=A0A078AKU0_STYLE|nr:UNKNOWN [Stylonychia lemnae]|eukprot:CDW82506.1 UNKNOWN [Stylonychia lemnae]
MSQLEEKFELSQTDSARLSTHINNKSRQNIQAYKTSKEVKLKQQKLNSRNINMHGGMSNDISPRMSINTSSAMSKQTQDANFDRLYNNFKMYEQRRNIKLEKLQQEELLKMQDKPQITQKSETIMKSKADRLPIYSEKRIKKERIMKEQMEIQLKLQNQDHKEEVIEEKSPSKINPERFIQNMEQRQAKFKSKWNQNKKLDSVTRNEVFPHKPLINDYNKTQKLFNSSLRSTKLSGLQEKSGLIKMQEYQELKTERLQKNSELLLSQTCTFKPSINKEYKPKKVQKSKETSYKAFQQIFSEFKHSDDILGLLQGYSAN